MQTSEKNFTIDFKFFLTVKIFTGKNFLVNKNGMDFFVFFNAGIISLNQKSLFTM